MLSPRIVWPLLCAVAFVACSGNLGGGQSTLPGTPASGTAVQQVSQPAATASPNSASNVATIGDSVAPQALPEVMGWAGTIAFPKPSPAPSPSPSASASPAAGQAAAGPVSIGVTTAVVEPPDAPHFGSPAGKGRRGKQAGAGGNTGLLYISLLSTADLTLGEYPKIGIEIPRAIAAKYRDSTFALALYDPEVKEKAYRLAVAERDMSSPAPGAVPTATPTPMVTPTAGPSGPFSAGSGFTPPPIGAGLDNGSLPPEHVGFLASAATLTLKANRPVVFALYAVAPQPSPAPSATARAAATPVPTPSTTASSSPAASPAPRPNAS